MRALVILALAVLATGAPAAADNREEARRAFSAGQAADKAKDWDQAIKHYLHAFELVPHHFAAYNVASDYEELGQLREAAAWFGRYLELAPPSRDRDKVVQRIADLRLRPAKLVVRSSPSGATVLVDGQPVGTTPYEHVIRGGDHRVAVELRGAREERDVVLEFGEPETVELALAVPDGVAAVAAPGATPSAGDAALGTAPRPRVLYIVGGAAGVDARGLGAAYVGEFGVRVLSYDLAARVGKAFGAISVEALARIGYGKGRLVPFLAFGYAYIGSAPSYEAGAGLRFDLVRGPTFGVAVVGEIAVRGYTLTKTDPLTMVESTESGAALPVLVSLQLLVGK